MAWALPLDCWQHKKVLEKVLPETLKITIAQKIENNLFSKVKDVSEWGNQILLYKTKFKGFYWRRSCNAFKSLLNKEVYRV